MAKLVDTTCAACLARENPVSTRAKPACMNMTNTAPITIHSRFICWPMAATGSLSCASAGAAAPRTSRPARLATIDSFLARIFGLIECPPYLVEMSVIVREGC